MKVWKGGPYQIHAIDGHHCILKDVDGNILDDLFPPRKLQHMKQYTFRSTKTLFMHLMMWLPDQLMTCFVTLVLTLIPSSL